MDYRPLGRTGVKVSELCLGAWMFGGRTQPEAACDIIDAAIDRGINFIDTANWYHEGRSEEIVGEALRRRGDRDRVVVATKAHYSMDDADPNARGNHRRHIIMQCEASLRRLKTDWIDLYQLHRPQPDIPIDETLRAMDDLIRDGKVRYIGTSVYAAWQLVEAIGVSERLGLNRFICEQPPYSLLDRRVERELLSMAQTYGVAVIPYSPLGGGLLTGKYRRGEAMPEDGRFTVSAEQAGRGLLTERLWDVIEGLEPIAVEKGVTLSQLALAWLLRQPGVTSPIIGPRTIEQFEDNVAAVDVDLTEDDLRRIDTIAPPGDYASPFYIGDWGPHPYRL